MGSMMEGPIKAGAAQSLQIALNGRGQGSDALGRLIAGSSITPDVFIPITASPLQPDAAFHSNHHLVFHIFDAADGRSTSAPEWASMSPHLASSDIQSYEDYGYVVN